MKRRVFLDTNVFIYAFEYPTSNSAKVIDFLNKGEIEVVVSEKVIQEVTRYFERFHTVELARTFRRYILFSCQVVLKEQVQETMVIYQGQIKEKDLEQLAAVKKLGLKYLLSYDRDFNPFEEYYTPKEFLQQLGKNDISDTEY